MKTIIIIKEESRKVNGKLMVHRKIEVNNKIVFDNTCNICIYFKDKSPLKQFTDWLNDCISREQFENTHYICSQRRNFFKSIQMFWLKLFGKQIKF